MGQELFHNLREGDIPRQRAPGIRARVFPGSNIMLSVVEIEPWSESPVHSHPNEQWGICLKGEWIRIQDGKEFKVKAGHFWETPSATAFRIDGAIVGRLQAGRARKPVAYGSDRVVVREEDEDGVVSMKVFRIMPASRP